MLGSSLFSWPARNLVGVPNFGVKRKPKSLLTVSSNYTGSGNPDSSPLPWFLHRGIAKGLLPLSFLEFELINIILGYLV